MGNYPYPSVYIVNGAQPPLPAFPVRVACSHLAERQLAPAELLGALGRAISVFYNHTQDLECLSFKAGVNPETGKPCGQAGRQAASMGGRSGRRQRLQWMRIARRVQHGLPATACPAGSVSVSLPPADEDADFWGYQYCTENFMPFSKDGERDM